MVDRRRGLRRARPSLTRLRCRRRQPATHPTRPDRRTDRAAKAIQRTVRASLSRRPGRASRGAARSREDRVRSEGEQPYFSGNSFANSITRAINRATCVRQSRTDGRTHGRTDEQDGQTGRRTDERTDGRTNGRMNGRMDGRRRTLPDKSLPTTDDDAHIHRPVDACEARDARRRRWRARKGKMHFEVIGVSLARRNAGPALRRAAPVARKPAPRAPVTKARHLQTIPFSLEFSPDNLPMIDGVFLRRGPRCVRVSSSGRRGVTGPGGARGGLRGADDSATTSRSLRHGVPAL